MTFENTLSFAQQLDANDTLKHFREQFYFPRHNGSDAIYFCGNSLGLQPKKVEDAIHVELQTWRELAVEGYFKGTNPWLYYHEYLRGSLAKIVGAKEDEITVMNALTVNLHFMMLSFYRPTKQRYKIMMEAGAFPSDQYAVETQVKHYGFDPTDAIVEISPRAGEKILRNEDIVKAIDDNKDTLALTIFGGINYYTGQLYDIPLVTNAAQKIGAIAGWDLAHVTGNVPTQLHNWNVDFAVWCSYKYLNAGPGAVGGVFVHERHANPSTERLAGWWGNDEKIRFKMEKGFIAKSDASGWNLSTTQVFNMVALKASLELFDEAGIQNLRAKSILLTNFLEFLLQQLRYDAFEIITPANEHQRGAQLCLFFKEKGKAIHEQLMQNGIIVDYREPGVIRVAPAPLYCSFEDVYKCVKIISEVLNTN
ncbi:kynureninase [Panacibacter ginsenosidivorans]|uniref:Kynureninase n=1 Tax=Panacibacter ginsenosidivorans TaxID=1813871 RepID=A0A5B8V960_9BACT|nr:kynureninase [Panacibacter ginsenosidivorans]QEC67769.1 kynureninase [Panacibacter ginsenosidivorans]